MPVSPETLKYIIDQIEGMGAFVALHDTMLVALWDQIEAAAHEMDLTDAELIALVYPSAVRDMEAAIEEQEPGLLDVQHDLALGAAAHMMLTWARTKKEEHGDQRAAEQ